MTPLRHKRTIVVVMLLAALALLHTSSLKLSALFEDYYDDRYRPLRMGTLIEIVQRDAPVAACSLGIPAYYDYYLSPDEHVRVYGVITASHCGDTYDSVYQNVTSSQNYIGYVEIDGRICSCCGFLCIRDESLPDAAFVAVETEYCGLSCDGPNVVSASLQHGFMVRNLNAKISSCQDLYQIYNEEKIVFKGGARTGLTWGLLSALNGDVCIYNPFLGHIFLADFPTDKGDSGGIVYTVDYINRSVKYIVLGIVVGKRNDWPVVGSAPVYIIEEKLGVSVYLENEND